MAPFRFGIVTAQAASGAEWKETAIRAEAAGYSSLLLPDGSGPVLSPTAEWFKPVVARLAGT